MKKRSWLHVCQILLLSIVLVACGNTNNAGDAGTASGDSGTETGDSGKVTTIKMQIAWASDSGRGKAIREILDEFEAQNPDIKVEMLGGIQYGQKLLTQILSGQAPEVLQVSYGEVKALASQGAFIDLTEDFAANESNYVPEIWQLAVTDGKLYGLPWLGHTIQLVYNKTMFEEAGITKPPATWEELYEVAKALTVDKNGDGKPDQFGIGLSGKQGPDLTWMYGMFAAQAGAKLVEEDGNGGYKVALNSPEGKQALEFYTKLLKETSPPDSLNKDGGGVMADFRNQVVAMELQGPWGVPDVWKAGSPFEVGVAEVPAGPAGKATEVTAYLLSIPDGVEGEKLEASKKLIEFLGSKPAQEQIMKGEVGEDGNYYPFRIPIRNDMEDTQYFKEHPEFLVYQKGLSYPFTLVPIPEWQQVSDEIYQSALNQVVSGRMSAEEGLKLIEKMGNEILAK
ncbi:sugar ABC transporter substrate-binding protein [Paenibacillus sp. 32O-W]|uniref:ABC transporter substrate-binding protein n=1 Tax=Paenibacillus sp. 32O-W TaxID=1695218 RepID=UPI00071F44A7|nr:sugar ABC transporter substrate-binding protein [Paenibacillus sp. 32O-W]ALS27132.1 sugar ABC transporter substrate-binding protein [Paenibacillus sp. 32O-W]